MDEFRWERFGALGGAAFVLWCLWILGVSHRLWSRQGMPALSRAA